MEVTKEKVLELLGRIKRSKNDPTIYFFSIARLCADWLEMEAEIKELKKQRKEDAKLALELYDMAEDFYGDIGIRQHKEHFTAIAKGE